MGVVPHHRPEDHFVVAALRAAEAAAHPGLHEHGAALEVPARGRVARHREVAVDQRLRILSLGKDLAHEEPAPPLVLLRRDVVLRHVDQLVVHQRVQALAGGKRLECVGQRRDVEHEPAVRYRAGVSVAVIREIRQEDAHRLRRLPSERAALPLERVGERAHCVRCKVPQRIEIDELGILRFDVRHAEGVVVLGQRGDGRQCQQQTQDTRAHAGLPLSRTDPAKLTEPRAK